MDVLLDTHALIWFYDGTPLLSDAGRAAIEDENMTIISKDAVFDRYGVRRLW